MSTAPFDSGNHRFRASLRRFVEREVGPAAARHERHSRFPRSIIRACGALGYLSLDAARTAVLAEELAHADSLGVALSVFVQAGLVAPMLRQLANQAQQRAWLAPLERGRLIAAVAVTEATAGSDFAAIACRAARTRRGFAIDGEKTYISAAGAADLFIVAVRMDEAPGPNLSLLLVPRKTRGVRVTGLASLGLNTTAMAKVAFRRCHVPNTALLGEAGEGYGYIHDALTRERLYGGIGAVAWAQRALDKTAAHLRTRRAFGRTLGRFQAVRHQMADLATELEAARQLNYATFAQWQAGGKVIKPVAMIKLFSYSAVQRAIATCLQLHGGLGYMDDHWTSRWYRDARALTIAAGTPEVMRDLIAAHLRL
jgi:acyl-CoA dehydrogenase